MMQLDVYRGTVNPSEDGCCGNLVVKKAKPAGCTHKPRYRLCLAAALGMTNALPATALPCEECSRAYTSSCGEGRWRTSSTASSQGGASTRAPTTCAEEDRVSWASCGNRSSTSISSSCGGFTLMPRGSSSSSSAVGDCLLPGASPSPSYLDNQYYSSPPTPSTTTTTTALQRLGSIMDERHSRKSEAFARSASAPWNGGYWPIQQTPLPPTRSLSLFALAVSHAASFAYEE
eukprot:Protomagalhaensia_sp_Gyna_25__1487@NODE_1760_length_1555_cov_2_757256_g1442_i0_p1_GENE_NODE_1760_length_1555_cov_2_757256_g1442_i0NODE_1760_length_1555_cov_2_757256_g1442_i0_p1_ORF_typecomplete_len232_score28_87zf_PR_Knuckle/PF18445_1/0_044_NODE_1760_length_1555_cov_2_757256_g1442_i05071202